MIEAGQALAGRFVILDAGGVLADPDLGPVGTLYLQGVATAAEVVIEREGTGAYVFSAEAPAGENGERAQIFGAYTMGTGEDAAEVEVKLFEDFYDLSVQALYDAAAEILQAIIAGAPGAITSEIFGDARMKAVVALARGRVTVDGMGFTFYGEDGITELFTLTYSDAVGSRGREVS